MTQHDFSQPQPEICEVCGTVRPGAEMRVVDGVTVCSSTHTCQTFRSRTASRHRLARMNSHQKPSIGSSRVYPPGQEVFDQ